MWIQTKIQMSNLMFELWSQFVIFKDVKRISIGIKKVNSTFTKRKKSIETANIYTFLCLLVR